MADKKVAVDSIVKVFEHIQQHDRESRNAVMKDAMEKLDLSSPEVNCIEDMLDDCGFIAIKRAQGGDGYVYVVSRHASPERVKSFFETQLY